MLLNIQCVNKRNIRNGHLGRGLKYFWIQGLLSLCISMKKKKKGQTKCVEKTFHFCSCKLCVAS